jgi:hypothetical protein
LIRSEGNDHGEIDFLRDDASGGSIDGTNTLGDSDRDSIDPKRVEGVVSAHPNESSRVISDDMRKMGLNLDVEPRIGSRVTPSSSNGGQRKRPKISSSSLSDNDTEEEWASSSSSDDDAEEEWDSNSGVGMSKSTRSRIGGLPHQSPKRIFEPISLVSGVGMSKSTRSRTVGPPYKSPKFGKIFDAISNGDINVFKSLSSELTCFRINLSEDCRIGCPTQGMKSVEVARYYGQSEMEKYLFEELHTAAG